MTFEEHKEFPVDSASLKEIRNFARDVLAKDECSVQQKMM